MNRPVMRQVWRQLLFLHFPIDPQELRGLIPEPLSLDLFPNGQGKPMAWIGFVPFLISDVALVGRLRVPTAHEFLETNVRTYIRQPGGEPAVWFFSLDAASHLACLVARLTYGLPYWPARMSMQQSGVCLSYSGERLTGPPAAYQVEVQISGCPAPAVPGSIEYFFVERYLLYSRFRGAIYSGRVTHDPYRIQSAEIVACRETLTLAARIQSRQFEHALFSPGVEVDVYGVRRA